MTNAIEVHGLRKVYRGGIRRRSRMALDGLDLIVPEGQVHGFLGPNGSGKTTTLRVLTGLVHADAGTVRVLGAEVPHGLPGVVSQLGSVVESPKFFPTFSGRRNLKLLAQVAGFDEKRVDEALEIVGLQGREDDLVKAYSLGMRQRLGIASALLKKPRLLLLDEPTNGLDPGGMREVRNLMGRLAQGGTTVLLSSHLLNEVQQVCSSVTIVSHGKAVRTGSVREVLESGMVAGATVGVRVRVADPPAAAAILTAAGLTVVSQEDHYLVTGAPSAEVNRMLGEKGIWADEIAPDQAALEDVFLSLTGEAAQTGNGLPPVEGPGPAPAPSPVQTGASRGPDSPPEPQP
ncbi:MAG TPA: ABC transporter ATP-binding protein [Actinomycetota bacterium]|nr:ABC transporter ATP-binding protein [Actinomycetota bacterium]